MKYNSLIQDIRLTKISLENALDLIKCFEEKWIYIESNINKIDGEKLDEFISNYNKFKVKSINVDHYSKLIFIYGIEDNDRLIISIDDIIQTEKSKENNELLFILNNKKMHAYIFIKLFVPNVERRLNDIVNINTNLIITEGKTDWKHLKAAFKKFKAEGLYNSLDFEFLEYEESLSNDDTGFFKKNYSGADTLNTICQYNAFFHNDKLRIFVFDADKKNINEIYSNDECGYTYLGNNVYAIILPLPEFRKNTPLISIENYYSDDEIKTVDDKGMRLYLSGEFDYETGEGKLDKSIVSFKVQKDAPNFVIDDNVYRNNSKLNISGKDAIRKLADEGKLEKLYILSKNKFAENILYGVCPFDKISKNNFKLFFDVVEKIFDAQNQTKQTILGIKRSIHLQEGITIELYDDHQDLNIRIAFPDDKINELRSKSTKVMSIFEEDGKVIISFGISIEKEFPLCILDISKDLISFIYKKSQNVNNRCYLHMYNRNKDYVASYEIFIGDNGLFQFSRLYESLKE